MKEKLFLAAGIICWCYYLVCGFYGGFKISVLWIWAVAGLGFTALGLGWLGGIWAAMPFFVRAAARLAVLLFLAVFLDYLIVLGAAVKGREPGQALRYRIDAAARYLSENPGTVAIVSGGQGPGEEITEAECMERELFRLGVPPERIVRENRSESTAENIRFSYELIEGGPFRVGILTNNFHVYRAVSIAKKQGGHTVCGVAAPYSGVVLPHYMVREFLTFVVDGVRGNL